MPSKTVTWHCNKCRSRHRSYREAENCEIGHIASDVIAEFRENLGIEPKNISPKERFK